MADTVLDQTQAELNGKKVVILAAGTPAAGDYATYQSADTIEPKSPDDVAQEIGVGSILLAKETISVAQAAVTFTTRNAPGRSGAIFQSDYNVYTFVFDDVAPVSNGPNFVMEVSRDGGSTWDTAAGSYFYALLWFQDQPFSGVQNNSSYASTYAFLLNLVENAAAGSLYAGVAGEVTLWNPLTTGRHKFSSDCMARQTAGWTVRELVAGRATAVGAVTAVRFRFTAGDVASGEITCIAKAR